MKKNKKWGGSFKYLIPGIIAVILLSGVLLSNKYKKKNILILIIFIFIYVGFHGSYMVYKYKNNSLKMDKEYLEYIHKNLYIYQIH